MFRRSLVVLLVALLSSTSLVVLNVNAQQELPTLIIHIESPISKTYTENTILLNISYNTQVQDQREYKIVYWLTTENTENVTKLFQGIIGQTQPIFQSIQIKELQDDNYSLLVSGEYLDGRWWIYAYETDPINFTISTENSKPTPSFNPEPFRFSSPNLIIASTITLLIGLGILAYIKKYRK
jgi:hypothetical protein